MSTASADPAPLTCDQAFEALKTYDRGSARATLAAIDDATLAAMKDPITCQGLEARLAAALTTAASPTAKEYICAKLALIGGPGSVPTLAGLLATPATSHAARNALQAMQCPEADKALRESLPNLSGLQKAGVVMSLGMRRDLASVRALARLLKDADVQVAAAAAGALGEIGTAKAAAALAAFESKAPAAVRAVLADARLICAERLLAAGEARKARKLYERLAKPRQPKHVQKAAELGLLHAAKPN